MEMTYWHVSLLREVTALRKSLQVECGERERSLFHDSSLNKIRPANLRLLAPGELGMLTIKGAAGRVERNVNIVRLINFGMVMLSQKLLNFLLHQS